MRSFTRKIPHEIPLPQLWAERLSSVLVVINLIFNEGSEPTSGDAQTWDDLCAEAIRLAPWVGWAPTRSKAAIGAVHASTPDYDATDWQRITALNH